MEKRKNNPVTKAMNEQCSHHYINRTKATILKKELEDDAEEQLKEFLNGTEESGQERI
jgi:uncharacterized membrane protein